MKKQYTTLLLAVLASLVLTIPAQAVCNPGKEELQQSILDFHGIETDMDIYNYLTLDAMTMTREAAVTAIIRSFGVYPANEPDHVWADELAQSQEYRPYIDYARRIGITQGIGNNRFDPKRLVTDCELQLMLERVKEISIEPKYPLVYDSPLCKLLSSDIQRGLSRVPDFLLETFYSEGRSIIATTSPFNRDGVSFPSRYVGMFWNEGNIWIAVMCDACPYYNQDENTIHELGHYLAYRTRLFDRQAVPNERDWLVRAYREYGDTNNDEFFADSFVMYITQPEQMKENAPTVYSHIESCLQLFVRRCVT